MRHQRLAAGRPCPPAAARMHPILHVHVMVGPTDRRKAAAHAEDGHHAAAVSACHAAACALPPQPEGRGGAPGPTD